MNMGALVLSRTEGRGIYIGPRLAITIDRIGHRSVDVTIEGLVPEDKISGYLRPGPFPGRSFVVEYFTPLKIGRDIHILVKRDNSQQVKESIRAPRCIAISRDDVAFETHMMWQERKSKRGAAADEDQRRD